MATTMEPQRQCMTALAHANHVRLARGAVKRAVAAGELGLAVALEHPAVATMALADLLRCQHLYGAIRAEQACATAQVNPARLIGELTARQRTIVVQACS